MKQKAVFLQSEGDSWISRNKQALASIKLPDDDALLREILELPLSNIGKVKVLEIGCGDGTRLNWIKNHMDADCYGIDPSAQGVSAACAKGINAYQGTADKLPFKNKFFDIVIFGFCLYLCDREDLFKIASETDRVLRAPGWLMILDFYSPLQRENHYHHYEGLKSYKMNYPTLFTWHPHFESMTHKVRLRSQKKYTDNQDEWVSVSVLRKCKLDVIK